MMAFEEVLLAEKPDWVVVIGDVWNNDADSHCSIDLQRSCQGIGTVVQFLHSLAHLFGGFGAYLVVAGI